MVNGLFLVYYFAWFQILTVIGNKGNPHILIITGNVYQLMTQLFIQYNIVHLLQLHNLKIHL